MRELTVTFKRWRSLGHIVADTFCTFECSLVEIGVTVTN